MAGSPAEHAGESRPDGMQRLLNSAVWDADLVGERRVSSACILEHLGDPQAVLVIDAHEFSQAWQQVSRGGPAALRHDGPPGKLEGAGCSSPTPARKATPSQDPELYLPLRWIKDRKRCQEAGIPDTVRFQTKCEQARQMIERLWQAKVPFALVVADTVYSGNLDLLT